eukprot:s4073_g1.t1
MPWFRPTEFTTSGRVPVVIEAWKIRGIGLATSREGADAVDTAGNVSFWLTVGEVPSPSPEGLMVTTGSTGGLTNAFSLFDNVEVSTLTVVVESGYQDRRLRCARLLASVPNSQDCWVKGLKQLANATDLSLAALADLAA